MTVLELLRQDVESYFHPRSLERGRDYYTKGRVVAVQVERGGADVSGTVQGSIDTPYRAEVCIDVARGLITDSDCTCPVGRGCKHAAAVVLTYIDRNMTNDSPGAENQARQLPVETGKNYAAIESLLSPVAMSALKALASSSPVPARTVRAATEQVQYVFHQKGNRVTIAMKLAGRNKSNGEWNAGRKIDAGSAQYSAPYLLTDLDRDIIDLWQRTSGRYYYSRDTNSLPDDPDVLLLLIKRVISTGRAYWESNKNPALGEGPSRSAQLRWGITPVGDQQLQLALDSDEPGDTTVSAASDGGEPRGAARLVVLNMSSPFYLDLDSWQIGQITTPLPPQTVQAALNVPPLSADQATAAAAWMQMHPMNSGIPLPSSDLEIEIRTLKPVPCMWLESKMMPETEVALDASGRVTNKPFRRVDSAAVWFERPQGMAENAADRQWKEGNKIIIEKYDGRAEQVYLQRLRGLNLTVSYGMTDQKRSGLVYLQAYDHLHWLELVTQHLDTLRQEGWKITTSPTFAWTEVKTGEEWTAIAGEGSEYWFSLDLGIDVNGKRAPLLPILLSGLSLLDEQPTLESIEKLNIDGKFYAPLDENGYVALDFARVKSIFQTLIELFDFSAWDGTDKIQISVAQAADLLDQTDLLMQGRQKLLKLAQKLKDFRGIERVAAPSTLKTELRPYQLEGLSWLQFLREFELGGILADDMGLGKTVQTLAHILLEHKEGRLKKPFLVVCPTSVIPNWQAEAQKLAPSLKVLSLHGSERSSNFKDTAKSHLVLTTYPLVLRDTKILKGQDWHAVVLDEAQAIKNSATKIAQTVCQLTAGHRICLTGTPVENHLGEIWSQFRFLMPGLLGDLRTFNDTFRAPIEKLGDRARQAVLGRRLAPFILRRTKTAVAPELPPKNVIVRKMELDGDQRDLYETVRLAMQKVVTDAIADKGLKRSKIVILDALLKLRQTCCDPRLLKLPAARAVDNSIKLECLMEMLTELVEEGRRIILFSQFTSMLDLIHPELERVGIPFVEIRGDTKDRKSPVAAFQAGEVPLFLISLKAGGTGLNLTAADTVIHYDPWWNPAVEDQATDRAHRIGQDKSVFVYKLIAKGTIEDRMLELQEKKRGIASAIFDPDKAGSLQLDDEDLALMFRPIA